MNQILTMALKDIRLISRDRMGMFFILFFPVLLGVFFGLVMGPSSSGGGGKMKVAIVDQDQSEVSRKFAERLAANSGIELETESFESAKESVRTAKRVAMVVLSPGFGDRAGVFWGEPPKIQLGLDPSRTAESAMLQGFVMQAIGDLVGERFNNPAQFLPFLQQARDDLNSAEVDPSQRSIVSGFLDSVDKMIQSAAVMNARPEPASGADGGESRGLQFADIQTLDVTRELDPNSVAGQIRKMRSRWDISFPQAMLWGVLGCIASFSISIARENTLGTMLRLQVAPIGPGKILGGKAMACFIAAVFVMGLLIVMAVALGMRPASYPKLVVASVVISAAFTGVMMVVSLLGRTEQGVAGAGTAINMIMAMLGGCMIPVMFMPEILRQIGVISPVFWAIRAIEGAVWREFSWSEMATPLAVLAATGTACLVVGVIMLRKRLG
jgi:ABC-2 type transport system permease protein